MEALAALILALFIVGAGVTIAGVTLLAGMPWGLICGGVFAFLAAALLRAGLPRNG